MLVYTKNWSVSKCNALWRHRTPAAARNILYVCPTPCGSHNYSEIPTTLDVGSSGLWRRVDKKGRYQRLGGTCCLHLPGWKWSQYISPKCHQSSRWRLSICKSTRFYNRWPTSTSSPLWEPQIQKTLICPRVSGCWTNPVPTCARCETWLLSGVVGLSFTHRPPSTRFRGGSGSCTSTNQQVQKRWPGWRTALPSTFGINSAPPWTSPLVPGSHMDSLHKNSAPKCTPIVDQFFETSQQFGLLCNFSSRVRMLWEINGEEYEGVGWSYSACALRRFPFQRRTQVMQYIVKTKSVSAGIGGRRMRYGSV